MRRPQVTILIPHYKTLALTRLCLRSIEKFTDIDRVNVVVIDNDSQDESTDYLRALDWIMLVERASIPGEKPIHAHSQALDLGLKYADTPYVLSIHTDTFVCKDGWLNFLLAKIEESPNVAGVGSWKLEYGSKLRLIAKHFERYVRTRIWYRIINSEKRDVFRYLRSHCALYRVDLLRLHAISFSDGEETAGRVMHKKLQNLGYKMVFISDHSMISYIKHLSHATQILNPDVTRHNSKARSKRARNRIERELESLHFHDNLN